jgi:MFS family permease
VSIAGVFFITVSLLAASFATTVVQLVYTQGVLQALGAAMVYNPYIFYMDDWFIKRKGFAYGIFWSGTGICGAIMPLIMEWALTTYGFRNTLRVWSALVVRNLRSLRLQVNNSCARPKLCSADLDDF